MSICSKRCGLVRGRKQGKGGLEIKSCSSVSLPLDLRRSRPLKDLYYYPEIHEAKSCPALGMVRLELHSNGSFPRHVSRHDLGVFPKG